MLQKLKKKESKKSDAQQMSTMTKNPSIYYQKSYINITTEILQLFRIVVVKHKVNGN